MILPHEIIVQVEKTALALDIEHGIIYLAFHVRSGQVVRHTIGHEESFQHGKELSTDNDSLMKRKRYRIKSRMPMDQ